MLKLNITFFILKLDAKYCDLKFKLISGIEVNLISKKIGEKF